MKKGEPRETNEPEFRLNQFVGRKMVTQTRTADTVCVWIAANADTYSAQSEPDGEPATEPDMVHGRLGNFSVATCGLGV